MRDTEADVGIKDIIEFYIRIDDSARAKSDIAKLSSSDKARAFALIAHSGASREFKIEIARYFVNDLDAHIRRKAELLLEDLVPGWVADPASSILQVLRSAEHKGAARRNAAVRFLFGIVDVDSLRITLTSLLSSSNRAHLAEIIEIVEQYIVESDDEQEQVKIFNACLDIVISDEIDMAVKHHASNLLSAFFRKVESTSLGEHLKAKYIERQTEKAESVYSFLCSGSCLLTAEYLEDLLRPLQEGCRPYQLKVLAYFAYLLGQLHDGAGAAACIDTMAGTWAAEVVGTTERLSFFRRTIIKAVEELWNSTRDDEVRDAIIGVVYAGHADKGGLLRIVGEKLATLPPETEAADKMQRLLRCFLKAGEEETLKVRAARLLIGCDGVRERLAGLQFLRRCLDGALRDVPVDELRADLTGCAAAVDEQERVLAGLLLFLLEPRQVPSDEAVLRQLLQLLRTIVEQEAVSDGMRALMVAALQTLKETAALEEKLRTAVAYLVFKLEHPDAKPTWDQLQ